MLKRQCALPVLTILFSIQTIVSSFSMGRWRYDFGSSNMITKFKLSTSSTRRSTGLFMLNDRLSDECVGAIMTAQSIGNEIGLKVLRNEILFAGVVGVPERAALTLAKYNMTFDKIKDTAVSQIRKSVSDLVEGGNVGKEALPFSAASKLVLDQALVVADGMNSQVVRSEHLLLALMGYNQGRPIEFAPALDVLANVQGLKGMDGKGFSCFKFCEQLVQDLDFLPETSTAMGSSSREKVTINRGGLGFGFSTLSSVGIDLTQMALEGKLDKVYGRDAEIRSALRTLGRRRKNNPCLIGEPGVGKTAVAEAIAQVLASSAMEEGEQKRPRFSIKNPFKKNIDNDSESSEQREVDYMLPKCPTSLAGARLISIDLASLVAGTANRGDFEKKVQNLIKEASTSNVILFIDEIHNLIGTGGGGDGTMNAANLLKPALARGELRILGATTTPEYRRYIEKDGALERRFQPLEIKEPSVDETIEILTTIMPRYEEYHGVEYTSNALVAAAKLSDRYVTDRFLPDKAIDLLDEAGSMIKMREEEENFFVTEDTVCEVISEISGIPIGRLDTGEKERLKNLDDEIGKRIKGQDQAVSAVSKAIRRSRSGMRDPKRPVSSFLFVGPTGVGKTELCKALAETYFGKEKDMIRIDMSEYMDRFSVSRLIGSPPGYVGYEEGGQLTEAVRRSPHSVVLFDELEKAHEDVLNILLQIMDEGKLTDGKGRTVNFKNTIIAMTSNIGSRSILEKSKESSRDDLASETSEIVKQELEQAMKPELLNRIDEIIVFKPLSFDIVKEIALNIFDIIAKRAANDQGIRMYISDNIAEIVTREGYVAEFGARPIRRAAKRYLEDTMAEAIIQDFVKDGDEVSIDLVAGPKNSVRITNLTANGVGDKSMIIAVEGDSGIGSTANLKWQRLYGPAPSLDDDGDEAMPREPDGFQ